MSLSRDHGNEYFAGFDEVNPLGDAEHGVPESSVENFNDLSLSDPSISESSSILPAQYSNINIHPNETSSHIDSISDFLFSLVKMERLLNKKRESVEELKKMNDMVEFQTSADPFQVTLEFQHKYATLILYLDELNQKLRHHIGVVIHHITEVAIKYGMSDLSAVTNWRRRCEDEAFELVSKLKTSQGLTIIDESKLTLIAKLTSILTLLTHLQENRISGTELGCIEEVFTDIRQHLHPCNHKVFEQNVEQLVTHIVYQLSPNVLSSVSSGVAPSSSSSVSNPNVSDVPYPS